METSILKEIAEEYKTPAYVFNLDELGERVNEIRKELGEQIRLCYAMKANPFLVEEMYGLVDCVEVCSPGEYAICERAEIPMEKIVLSGVNKEYEEILRVIRTYKGKGIFTIESEQHLNILADSAREGKQTIKVFLRLSSGNQFGMDEETVLELLSNWSSYPYLEFQGIQFYSGTQKKLALIEKELKHLDEFCMQIEEACGITVPELEYGPGFQILYFEEPAEEQELLKSFKTLLNGMDFKGKITLEMGRFLTALCGYYLTSIVDVKSNFGQNYCIVDGGIHHINYYGQMMAMKIPPVVHISQKTGEKTEKWNVCGSLCTVGDILVKQLLLKNAGIGDILVFGRLGAYSVTEGIYLFLSRDLPKVLFYSEDNGTRLIRDAQATNFINSIR